VLPRSQVRAIARRDEERGAAISAHRAPATEARRAAHSGAVPWSLPRPATVRAVVRLAVLTAVAGLLIWAVVPTALGWRAALITSGSMEPGIRAGDLVILVPITAEEVGTSSLTGAVVQVNNPVRPGDLLVHRVVGKDPAGAIITKGDANASRDYAPVQPSQVLGVARIRVPYVGLPVLWLRNGQKVPLAALGTVLLVLLWPERRRPTPAAATEAHDLGLRRIAGR
jgi:signal peptidase